MNVLHMPVPCHVTFERCCVQVRGCFGRERVPVKPARPALSMWYAGILKTIAMAALYGPVSPAVYPLSLLSLAFQYYQKRVTFAMFKLSFPAMNERVVVTAMHLMSAGGVLHVFMVLTIALGLDATWLLICTLLSAGVWLVKSGAPLRLPCWLPLLRSHYCPEQPPALPVHCIERLAWGLSGRRATMLATKKHMLGVQAGQSPPAPQPEAYASPLDVLKLGVRARVVTCWSATLFRSPLTPGRRQGRLVRTPRQTMPPLQPRRHRTARMRSTQTSLPYACASVLVVASAALAVDLFQKTSRGPPPCSQEYRMHAGVLVQQLLCLWLATAAVHLRCPSALLMNRACRRRAYS